MLPLGRQVEGAERRTVRRGEHPRDSVHRVDLLDDEGLDRLRARHPDRSAEAMDAAVAVDEELERALALRGIDGAVERLPARPLLAVYVCLECGASVIASATRSWEVDRTMRETGSAERDVDPGTAGRSRSRADEGGRR